MRSLTVFVAAAALLAAFAPPAAHGQSPLSFDLNLAPNTTGALEGSAAFTLRWSGFAQSGLYFSADTFMERYAADSGETTVIRDTVTLDLELFRLADDLLALEFPGGGLSASVAAIANGAVIDEDRYGHGGAALAYVFYQGQRTMWLKPLLGVDASGRLGPATLSAYYRTSWPFELDEYVDGTALYSTVGSETPFSIRDRGFETRLGASLGLRLAEGWALRGGFDWLRHIGYSISVDSATGTPTEYVYEMVSMEGSLTLEFPVGGYRPLVGVAWALDRFSPLELYSVAPYENARWRLIVGLRLY